MLLQRQNIFLVRSIEGDVKADEGNERQVECPRQYKGNCRIWMDGSRPGLSLFSQAAAFAGHSLGEFSALAAVADILPIPLSLTSCFIVV
jgi:hypothetical protein